MQLVIAELLVAACGDPPEEMRTLTREELLDPETCKGCHPRHYREWSVSMHAYAADDPVFIAMNTRGQDETEGEDHELGDFCVRCHAPMALVENRSFDAADVAALPRHQKGVTCYFCHNAVGIGEHANGDIQLANDTTMRGGFGRGTERDPLPVQPPAHRAEYSRLHDPSLPESSALCGACHDVITPGHGVHLERTFAEYESSIYAQPTRGFQSCQDCHMRRFDDDPVASYPGALPRGVHEHLWPGVDVAMTDFPDSAGRTAMRAAVEECALRNGLGDFRVELVPDAGRFLLRVTLETAAGHAMPSGAAQDRRMWVEIAAYDAEGRVLLQSGEIADNAPEEHPEDHPDHDRFLWLMRDRMLDADGREVHMFWDAVSYDAASNPSLPPPTPELLDHKRTAEYPVAVMPARARVRVRMRPIGMDVLHDLVDAGYLDAALLAEMPTFTVAERELSWTPGNPDDPEVTRRTFPDCERYKCLLDPHAGECAQ